jgi:rod shape-determining protein MreD
MAGRILASIIPVLCGIIGALIANVPISFAQNMVPPPLFALMPIYYWCLVRPDLMTPGWAFIVGVSQDLFSGGPPGIWTLSFVAAYALIDRQRDQFAGLSGFGAILGFATAALTACLSAFIIYSLYHWRLASIAGVVSQFALTVFFYLPVAALLGQLHHKLVGPLRSDF